MQRYNVLQRVPNNEPFSSSVCYDSLAYLRQTTGDGPILVAKIKNLSPRLRFNVGIDDKFGFEPETDWIKVIETLGRF